MQWHRVEWVADEARAEAQAADLFAEGAVAVEREGAALVGHFLAAAEAGEAAAALGGSRLGASARPEPDPAWAAEWLAAHAAFAISPRLCVGPRWVAPPAAVVALTIDPGLAFGTAAHPTTFLCLQALDAALEGRATPGAADGPAVLDVGCGTGVLAIAAVRLGAARAAGTDLDPHALRAARRLARLNRVADDRLALGSEAPDARGRFPLVLANLPPPVIDALCAPLCAAVAPGGTLLLSGFLAGSAGAVEAPFASRGLRRRGLRLRQGWGLLDLGA